MSRYEVTPSGGWSGPVTEDRYCVHPEDSALNVAKHIPHAVAHAIARHLNAEPQEPGDTAALVGFILAKGRA